MTALPNDVMSLLQKGSESYSDASTGLGGDWPPAGQVDAIFRGVTASMGAFKVSREGGGDPLRTIPCVNVRLSWGWTAANGDPLSFDGQLMQLIPGFEKELPDTEDFNYRRARDAWQTFKNATSKLLRKPPQDCVSVQSDLEALAALANGETATMAQLEISERPNKKGGAPYRSERIVQVIA